MFNVYRNNKRYAMYTQVDMREIKLIGLSLKYTVFYHWKGYKNPQKDLRDFTCPSTCLGNGIVN